MNHNNLSNSSFTDKYRSTNTHEQSTQQVFAEMFEYKYTEFHWNQESRMNEEKNSNSFELRSRKQGAEFRSDKKQSQAIKSS